ncbi:hypothetical protein SASPL_128113 [Salvia splendens]|uniref:RRM domain-containing protein n=1 Tax=Salvia splendens TaxID=180675 RepID=A0A8X8XAP8_SALSN|nr:hypothetical protein SASPL_128113 [Salvia splendens]
MADAFWRYGDNRQPAVSLPAQMASKRTRSEFEMPSGRDTSSYYTPCNERPGNVVPRDTDSVNASYERYLRSLQVPSYGGQTGRPATGGLDGVHEIDDLRVLGMVQSGPAAAPQSRLMGVGGRPEISLPPDASSTLFVEGLPANCTRREVSHIFRPFVGYKEVRLVNKAPRNPGGDPVVLCFVDFESPAHAATAMDALQGQSAHDLLIFPVYNLCISANVLEVITRYNKLDGETLIEVGSNNDILHLDILFESWLWLIMDKTGYLFDENERDSGHLRVQFARNPPGPRLGGGHRANR